MLKIRLLVVCVLLAWLSTPALAAKHTTVKHQTVHHAKRLSHSEKLLLGLWQDGADHENIIRFKPDHTVAVYVPRQVGQTRNVHWLNGSWRLSRRMVLTVILEIPLANGTVKKQKRVFHIAFKKDVMIVKAGKSGKQTLGQQFRISEQQLKPYLW